MQKCKIHPKYQGVEKPKINAGWALENGCECHAIYLNKHPDEKFPNFIGGQMMSLNDWREAGRKASQNLIKNFRSEELN